MSKAVVVEKDNDVVEPLLLFGVIDFYIMGVLKKDGSLLGSSWTDKIEDKTVTITEVFRAENSVCDCLVASTIEHGNIYLENRGGDCNHCFIAVKADYV